MLQVHLQNHNITTSQDLPRTIREKVKFFQELPPSLEKPVFKFLQESLNGFMPEYVQAIQVGGGYDVSMDEVILASPFESDELVTSPMGYLLPSYLSCMKVAESHVEHTQIFPTYLDYAEERLRRLQIQTGFNLSTFNGRARSGYNVDGGENNLPSLTTGKEFRKFVFKLNDNVRLKAEFTQALASLGPLNLSKKDSVKEWKLFFEKYGTHVVVSGYVGGRVAGLLLDDKLRDLTVENRLEILKTVVSFEKPADTLSPSYNFYGGDGLEDPANLTSFDSETKTNVLGDWERSLGYDPIGLDYDLMLEPISSYVKAVNGTLGREVEEASKLFMSNQLVYVRVKGAGKKRNKNQKGGTARPIRKYSHFLCSWTFTL
jgi:hypothetical protein